MSRPHGLSNLAIHCVKVIGPGISTINYVPVVRVMEPATPYPPASARVPPQEPAPATASPKPRPAHKPQPSQPSLRPQPSTSQPSLRPQPSTSQPSLRPRPSTSQPSLRPRPSTSQSSLRPQPSTSQPSRRPQPSPSQPSQPSQSSHSSQPSQPSQPPNAVSDWNDLVEKEWMAESETRCHELGAAGCNSRKRRRFRSHSPSQWRRRRNNRRRRWRKAPYIHLMMDVETLRYSQLTIKDSFQCGRSISLLVHQLLTGTVSLDDPFLCLTAYEDTDYETNLPIVKCIDNRRLFALKEYARETGDNYVNINLVTEIHESPDLHRIIMNSDRTNGHEVRIRKGGQKRH